MFTIQSPYERNIPGKSQITYPTPQEPRPARKSTYFVVGAIVVVLALAAFFFVHGVKEDSENTVEQTGQPATQNPIGSTGQEPSGTGMQPPAPTEEGAPTPGTTGTNQ